MPQRSLFSVLLTLVLGGLARWCVPVVSATFVPAKPLSGWKQSAYAKHTPDSNAWKRLSARISLSGTMDDSGRDNDDEDDDDEQASSPGRLRRKRDRIKQWMSSGNGNKSPMVRPIRMEDGSVEEEDATPRRAASRLKANFDDLFAGMPSMQDILGENEDEDSGNEGRGNNKIKVQIDDSWFDEEKKQIEVNYKDIYQEMIAQVEEQRQQDPEGVPSNAEAMIKDVLQQEMITEIETTKEARAKENLATYSNKQKDKVEAQDMEGVSSEVVDKLLKEDEAAKEKVDAAQARVDEYRRYELEAFLKNQNVGGATEPQAPDAKADLDQWALERLQDMVDNREEGEDDDFIVTDIVEDSLEDLKDRIDREAGRSPRIQPGTLKEWQMYRAISSRLGMQNGVIPDGLDEDASEELIASQLQAWKDYVDKEGLIREKSGLARGPKLPFEWQESGRDKAIEDAQIKATLETQGAKTKVEIRKEVNRKSIEAMEKLLETSDAIRGERLRRDIDVLKQELEANDYLDVDESTLAEEPQDELGPVDISDVFTTSDEESMSGEGWWWNAGNEFETTPPPDTSMFEGASSSGTVQPRSTPFFNDEASVDRTRQTQPATPFLAQDEGMDEATEAPDTPFFSSSQTGDIGSADSPEYTLGTVEEQKLRAMYQRAGARADEEKAAIRAQWEEFQKFEQSRRDESGLTDDDDSELLNRAAINYDISEVATEDGDFDAAKILASIGPRPSRKRKGGPSGDETVDSGEMADSLYRAVSAVGGGRTKDDPEAKEKEKAAFSEFVDKENEIRDSLDNLDDEIATQLSDIEGEFDDSGYAEDALSSLGPRPKPKRRKLSETEYSDRSIALSSEEEDDDRISTEATETQDELVPGWLRKERGTSRNRGESSGGRGSFLGSDIDDVFNDDEYEHNMRQLAEYERRRAGGKKQMGIDISDVFGRNIDDYADYAYDDNYFRAKKAGWGTSGFEARKDNLLDYTELSVMELNSLMDHKDSVHSTGVSQYLPRINKPFKEFGAIFRLEGVLIDTTGMQNEAWRRVAEAKGFRNPTLDEVRRASVLRSDVAIREAFFWTDDVISCREAVDAHEQALNDVFVEWMRKSSISPVTQPETEPSKGSLAIGEVSAPMQPSLDPMLDMDEDKKLKLLADAWSRTAITHRLASPSRHQIEMASVLNPELAVRKAFQWSAEQSEIDTFVATYGSIMRDLLGTPQTERPKVQNRAVTNPESPPAKRVLDQSNMMELEFKAWSKLAKDNNFEMPLPEEVMAAVVINDPEIAIRDGFGWTDDTSRIPSLIASYKESLNGFVTGFTGVASSASESPPPMEIPATDAEEPTSNESGSGPTQEELLEMQQHAWKSAALNHSFKLPEVDQLQVAMRMSPSEAVSRLFGWTFDESLIEAVCITYSSALNDISQKYIQKYALPAGTRLFPSQPTSTTSAVVPEPTVDNDDVFQAVYEAWTEVAKKNKFPLPDEEQILFAMSVGPEEAVISGFEWAEDLDGAIKIVDGYKKEIQKWRSRRGRPAVSKQQQTEASQEATPLISVVPGAEKWLQSLLDVEMQCAVVSHMSRQQLDVLLEVSGLSHMFTADKRVTGNNNYGRDMDQLLGAALRVERRPDHCVVFDASPNAAVAAQRVDMRSVGVIGAFPRYDLLFADSTAGSFDELTAMNIRRLFGERVYDQPMVDMQQADPEKVTRQKTKFFWEDD